MAMPVGDGLGTGVRLAMKQVVTVGLALGDRLQGGVGEVRAQLTSLVAEARAEQQATHAANITQEQGPTDALGADVAEPGAGSPLPDLRKGQSNGAGR